MTRSNKRAPIRRYITFYSEAWQVEAAPSVGSLVMGLVGSRWPAWTVLVVPLLDEGRVGAGVDAELGCGLVRGIVGPGVMPGQALARVPGQQVGPGGGDLGQRGESGGPALGRRGSGGRVPAERVRDLAQHLAIAVRFPHARNP